MKIVVNKLPIDSIETSIFFFIGYIFIGLLLCVKHGSGLWRNFKVNNSIKKKKKISFTKFCSVKILLFVKFVA